MVAYQVEQASTKTKFITSDILDVWTAIEKVTDGTPVQITTKELSVTEFNQQVELLAVLNLSIKTPWINDKEQPDSR